MKLRLLALILFVLSLSSQSVQATGKIWAVLVGVDNYQYASSLAFCVNDVTKFRDFLIKSSADINHIALLTDTASGENKPAYSRVCSVLEQRMTDPQVSPEDTFFFYFSGHGMNIGGKDYLMPMDAVQAQPERTGYPVQELYNLAGKCRAGKVIVILDACRDRGDGKGMSPRKSFGADARRFTVQAAQKSKSKRIITIQSCAPEEVSYEMPDKGQGVFSYYLLKGLDQLHKRTLKELMCYLGQEVPAWVNRNNKPTSQTPSFSLRDWDQLTDIALLPDTGEPALATIACENYTEPDETDFSDLKPKILTAGSSHVRVKWE